MILFFFLVIWVFFLPSHIWPHFYKFFFFSYLWGLWFTLFFSPLYFAFIWFNLHYRIGCFSVLSAILILVSFLCQIYEFLRQDAWKESIADQVICNLKAQVQVFIFIFFLFNSFTYFYLFICIFCFEKV